jgi:F-type H+-transporting ATPase subunit delta
MISEVARRYGRALYELSSKEQKQDRIFSELRILSEAVNTEPSIQQFFNSPIVKAEQKIAVIQSAIGQKLSPEIMQIMDLLARKNRLSIFSDMVNAFEAMSDEAHGVSRGTVKSSRVLSPSARKQIEETVAQVTKKKVILNFSEDPSLLGGMVAQVGGWTFDDSLETHLTRMSEDLNRRTN